MRSCGEIEVSEPIDEARSDVAGSTRSAPLMMPSYLAEV